MTDEQMMTMLAPASGDMIAKGATDYLRKKKIPLAAVDHEKLIKTLQDRTPIVMDVAAKQAQRLPVMLQTRRAIAGAFLGSVYRSGWLVAAEIASGVK